MKKLTSKEIAKIKELIDTNRALTPFCNSGKLGGYRLDSFSYTDDYVIIRHDKNQVKTWFFVEDANYFRKVLNYEKTKFFDCWN